MLILISIWCGFKILSVYINTITWKSDFAEEFKNLVRYRLGNNFVGPSKQFCRNITINFVLSNCFDGPAKLFSRSVSS